MTTTTVTTAPGLIGRIRSRQAGHPSGLLGRIIGRAMVKDTAAANDRAVELLELGEPSTVLEVGYGQGRTAATLLDQGHRVLGVEVSDTMVNQARARNRRACRDGRAELRGGDGRTVPFDDATADAAVTVHTIYFMPDPAATIAEDGIAAIVFGLDSRVGDDRPGGEWAGRAATRIHDVASDRGQLVAAGFAPSGPSIPGRS